MKIALLGPSKSGKTVYFTGVYKEYSNNVDLLPLTSKRKQHYIDMFADQRVRFQVSVNSPDLKQELEYNSERLNARPLTPGDWPEPTEKLDKAKISTVFEFESIHSASDGTHPKETFRRDFEVFDPAGDVFSSQLKSSDVVVSELTKCDVCIVMIPSDKIVNIFKDYDPDEDRDEDVKRLISEALHLGTITDILGKVRDKSPGDDIIPICLAITKSDEMNLHKNVTQFLSEHLYDNIIIPFSKKAENKNLIICVTPVSVVNPKHQYFSASNLEWPFLFATGGTILRNSQYLDHDASDEFEKARVAEAEVEKIKSYGFWKRHFNAISRVRNNYRVRQAQSEGGRLIKESKDDLKLARNIWSALATEGKANGVQIFKGGVPLEDPRRAMM